MKNIPHSLSGPQLNKRAESGKSDDFANKCKFYLIKPISQIKVEEKLTHNLRQ
jgi:hypothetical protein